MNNIKIAVLLTVFNRKDVTIRGLKSLESAIKMLPTNYHFDVYMTDDGCTDGTSESVTLSFPYVNIIKGNGNLFWGGGMRAAWEYANGKKFRYDYFIWFNDDVVLYENALSLLFQFANENTIISGAFCDEQGNVSYGGKTKNNKLIIPNGHPQDVWFINGNLVLIPSIIVDKIGIIDRKLKHVGGDFEYGLRAVKNGYRLYLTSHYVGICNRHDEIVPKYCNASYSFHTRLNFLKSPVYAPSLHFYLNRIQYGYLRAVANFILCYIGAFSPRLYSLIKSIVK